MSTDAVAADRNLLIIRRPASSREILSISRENNVSNTNYWYFFNARIQKGDSTYKYIPGSIRVSTPPPESETTVLDTPAAQEIK